MAKTNDMADMLAKFEVKAAEEHTNKEAKMGARDGESRRVIAQISMPKEYKEHLSAVAKEHGLSLSAFCRLAADEYIEKHGWNRN